MNQELNACIVLKSPVSGVRYALQKWSGTQYEVVQAIEAAGHDLHFKFP
ncbi:hypothetical protein [Paraflavitalea speifideaquila]|nr:hypothetical protein [Paraflavitalea speifideiaquila]